MTTVCIYVDIGTQVDDLGHLKVFVEEATADTWLAGGFSRTLMTLNHRVPGSSPGAPSHQTADFQAESKQAVSVGIFAGVILLFQSPVTPAVFQADFSLPSLHPKIPFPAAGLQRPIPLGNPGILGAFWAKTDPFVPGP
jgi:hypothetical protein